MSDAQPHNAEDQGPYDPDQDYTFTRLHAAYDLVAEGETKLALTGLGRLQEELDPQEHGKRSYRPDYELVTQAIADVFCLSKKFDYAREELSALLEVSQNNPVTSIMLAKVNLFLALSSVTDIPQMAIYLENSLNHLLHTQEIYDAQYVGFDEQSLAEAKYESHVTSIRVAAEVCERDSQLRPTKNYKSILVSSAEIAAILGGYELGNTFLSRHEGISPLNARGIITRAEIQIGQGHIDGAWRSYHIIDGMELLPTERTIYRARKLKRTLLAAGVGT